MADRLATYDGKTMFFFTSNMSPSAITRMRVVVFRLYALTLLGGRQEGNPACKKTLTGGDLDVPRCRLSTYGRPTFSCAGPAAWNSLPDRLKNSTLTIEQSRRLLKSSFFLPTTALEIFMIMRCISSHLHCTA